MKSTEKMEHRLLHVDMHTFFLNRISQAMDDTRFIEAAWLIYSALENRYFRTIMKFKDQCKYSRKACKQKNNQLALSTKIGCVKRLHECGVTCVSDNFPLELFSNTKTWVKQRNTLMHDLFALDKYGEIDVAFEEIARQGIEILDTTYAACTDFRKDFYAPEYAFVFPIDAMEQCPCKPRSNEI